jgi:hypothetical protein
MWKEESGITISLMYSVTMSSRTRTVSGFGFGSSPKAYKRLVTAVSDHDSFLYTVFLEEVLLSSITASMRMVGHGSLCVGHRLDDRSNGSTISYTIFILPLKNSTQDFS